MREDKKLSELAQIFAEKNPTLLRNIMESHFIRMKDLEFSQGKLTKGNIENINLSQ